MKREKTKSIFVPLFLLVASVFFTLCKSPEKKEEISSNNIFINQVGYIGKGNKKALVKSFEGKYKILDLKSNKLVGRGEAKALGTWKYSGDNYSEIDFSNISQQGSYVIELNNGGKSFPINVSNETPVDLYRSAMRSFYLNRASMPIEEKYCGKWARNAGHPDNEVIIHKSAASETRKAGDKINSPGGWYDAGDYNKYIVNSAITVYTLLTAYDQYSDVLENLDFNIPESKNAIPDILDETIYNVNWMLTMQDDDGGVYHKLTTETFEEFIMPEDAVSPRYVVMKTTPAALDFAASMAACSRIIADVEGLEELSTQCLAAAKKAWTWAKSTPDLFYVQPKGFNTGEYKDTNLTDEWLWASVEMFLATGEKTYFNGQDLFSLSYPYLTPSWDVVHSLALMSVVANPEKFDEVFYQKAEKEYLSFINELYLIYKTSPALISLDYFKWGSNSDVANQSMLAFLAYNISNDKKYAEMAISNIDYLLGRNPTGYCFISGFGEKTPMNIHHRPSSADGIKEPVPGFLIGGPNTIVLNDCGEEIQRSTFPALSYTDSECSYSTNEIAINWTAPFVYAMAGMIDYIEK